MRKYQVTIVMSDGSSGIAWGLFSSDWEAIDRYMGAFPEAKSIIPRRLS